MTADQKRDNTWWVDVCAIYALTVALIFPLFRVEYLDMWTSIESTFIADARSLQENWPHHLWQPLWYMGTRAYYVYPPGLRYGVAIVSSLLAVSPARAYHLFIALFYALGIAVVYLWVRTGTQSRGAAWLAAAGVALISPSFLILTDMRMDSPFHVPVRLHVLMTYGEGPHISSLAVLPIAWLGAWRRFRGGGIRWLLLSACAAAAVVTINFYGATALAITFPLLAWACFLERGDWRILRDSLIIAVLAYGLTAWWLTPSYLQVTMRDLRLVAPESSAVSRGVFAMFLIVYLGAAIGIRRRIILPAYAVFVWSGWAVLSLYVLGYQWFGLQVAGDSHRLIPEWDLFAIFCGVALVTRARKWRPTGRLRIIPRVALVLLLVACFRPSWRYLKHAYVEFRPDVRWQQRVEYRTQDWLWRTFPGQRVFVPGSIRFWYNAWHDGQQADGGSLQGILNPLIPTLEWRMVHADDMDLLRHWLQAMGVDILVIPGPTSQEPYQDFKNSPIEHIQLPLLRDDQEGNRYYRVPRRVPGMVRVIDRIKVWSAPPIPVDFETDQIRAYADAIEAIPPGGDPPDRARAHWRGSDQLDVDVETRPGEALLIQEAYDPYWRAYVDGRVQIIRRDAAGLMNVDLPPGRYSLRLVFETPLEISFGRIVTAATLALLVFLGFSRTRPGTSYAESRVREALE